MLDVIIMMWYGNFHRLIRDAVNIAREQKRAVVMHLFGSYAMVNTNLEKDIAVCMQLKIHLENTWISDCYFSSFLLFYVNVKLNC